MMRTIYIENMIMQTGSNDSNGNKYISTGPIPNIPSSLGSYITVILNRNTFYEVVKGGSVSFRYQKGVPLVLRLGGKDNSDNSMTELLLISSEDYRVRYGHELSTPYFIINTGALPLREEQQGYKGVRIHETIRLGLHSDPTSASRLGLDKNPYISRFHMELELRTTGEFVIRDLGSTNGTFLSYPSTSFTNEECSSQKSNIQKNMDEIAKNRFLSNLWPNLSNGMKQGPVGNCYFVAAINSIKEHPQGATLLQQMIQPYSQGYMVRFLGIDQFTIISNQDIADMGNKKLSGSLGDHILERAYWRLRHNRYDPSLRGGFSQQISRTNGTLLAINHQGNLVHEGGWMKEVLSDFLGNSLYGIQEINDLYLSSSVTALSSLKGDELITASTPSLKYIHSKINSDPNKRKYFFSIYFPPDSLIYKEAERFLKRNGLTIHQDQVYERISQEITYGVISGDGEVFYIQDINNRKQEFHFQHAYSIGHIDHTSGYVELINPHDTVKERFYVSIENFYRYFYNVTIARVKQ